jgi:hypothetical protein
MIAWSLMVGANEIEKLLKVAIIDADPIDHHQLEQSDHRRHA